ncbi:maleylpyruvate isomerase family mycothiol-dependent enzyme [Streptomyces ficellus]|uniref:Maleylpyruvate isomerase family mycothiol-dependent enzyme n=1 Tax=Streptomyces ficellus TaxID=1977088 RepID=A0A6I6FR96_9ACTN|nr:maleylpyruvate isomerase family mycothiol-dependent enzyme [Streptomyces ficellus]QGV79166.1 maleylpyruvate isomerase family mycothiol-dependent enzyme [Streptomyces ficellus]
MVTTSAPASALDIPRTHPLRARAVNLAEMRAMVAALDGLAADDWTRVTACEGWTVRDLATHVVAQYEELARPWLLVGRAVLGRRRYPRLSPLHAHNQCQVDARREVPPHAVPGLLARFGPRGVRAVERLPGAARRRIRLSPLFPESKELAEDSMDYLARVLVTRDTWMHRVDVCDATGRDLVLREHDKEVVGQVLLDLALDWSGPPAFLDLSGPAGGRWTLGRGTPSVVVQTDAVTLMRQLSGRPATGVVEYDGARADVAAFAAARVVF